VAGGETRGADLTSHAKQRLKFYIGIAIGAGDGSTAGEILIDEGAYDAGFEVVFEIYDVVRKGQMLGDAFGVVDIVDGAAAASGGSDRLQGGQATLIPKLHGEAYDAAILFLKEGRDYRTVDAAAHGHGDDLRAGRGFAWKGVELEIGMHERLMTIVLE
jgi:hypothetical protein